MFIIINKQIKRVTVKLIFLFISLGIITSSSAEEISETVKDKIAKKYPGAEIVEIREDIWNGRPVTEVEARTVEGRVYEFIISEDEDILQVEEEKGLPLIGGELSLGAAVIFESDVYRGVDSEIQPVPFLRYENGPFEIMTQDGLTISYKIFQGESYSIAALGEYIFEEGYDPGDSNYLTGMDELGSTYSVGLESEIMVGDFIAGIELLHDISSEKSGQEVEFSLEYPWHVAGLNVSWLSRKKVDYLYGVSAREATLARPLYDPASCFEIGAELMIQKPFLENYTFLALIEANKLGSEISSSPIVDDDIEMSAVLGIMYNF